MNEFEIRPFSNSEDFEAMIEYFHSADPSFLLGMGVDSAKLPLRAAWLEQGLADLKKDPSEVERLYVVWIYKGQRVGHSNVNKIKVGEEAYIHLHLWNSELRGAGLGTEFLKRSINYFIEHLKLKKLFCEPNANNPAPNKSLPKLGFRFVKRYRTVPGSISFEQDVNLYEVSRETI